jgi:hypothetical protein
MSVDLDNVSFLIHTTQRGTLNHVRALAVPVRFYRTDAGTEPVLEWLRSLEKADRRAIGLGSTEAAARFVGLASWNELPIIRLSGSAPKAYRSASQTGLA